MEKLRLDCNESSTDHLTATGSDYIRFEAHDDRGFAVSVHQTASAVRTFARGLLALCDEADGGEAPAEPQQIKVGDRVRVVVADPGLSLSAQYVGRTGTVDQCDPTERTKYLVRFGEGYHGDPDGTWWCETVEPVSVEPTDKAAPEGVTTPTRSALILQARDLLAGQAYTAHDLIRLAEYLAEEKR